jgi:hypothetical protein
MNNFLGRADGLLVERAEVQFEPRSKSNTSDGWVAGILAAVVRLTRDAREPLNSKLQGDD